MTTVAILIGEQVPARDFLRTRVRKVIGGMSFGLVIAGHLAAAEAASPELALPPVTSSAAGPRGALSFRWENDAPANTDQNYSNGIELSLTLANRGLLGGFWNLFGKAEREYSQSFEIGQILATPQDINSPIPDPNDRPYAGLLYFGMSTQIRQGDQFKGLKIVTGVVGPASLGQQTQTWFHRVIGSGEPQGWDYQLHNEPILNFVYEHRWKFSLFQTASGFGADVLPTLEAMVGNVLIQGQFGAQARIGYRLPDDFGTSLVRGFGTLPSPRLSDGPEAPRFGVFGFASLAGSAVARNITLDGNTFQDSPRVDKYPFFPSWELGVSVWTRWCQITAS